MKPGRYRTRAGSTVTLSDRGSILNIDFQWDKEGACVDCTPDKYLDGDELTWDCAWGGGGRAKLEAVNE